VDEIIATAGRTEPRLTAIMKKVVENLPAWPDSKN
jgi:hypothetical protein